MRIHSLSVENVKRIKIARIDPKKNVVIFEGPNEAGKTSLMDSICYLLGGEKLIPEEPVRRGEKHAEIRADLGDYTARRFWKGGRSYLEIKTKDGMIPGKPQTFLNSLIGDLSFDPLQFCNQDRRDRVETLRQISGLDFSDLDELLEQATEDRKISKQQLKSLEGQAEQYADIQEPGEPADLAELTEKYKNILDSNKAIHDSKEEIEELKRDIARARVDIQDLEINIEKYLEKIKSLEAAAAGEKQDPAPVLEQMTAAEQTAAQRAKYESKIEIEKEMESKREEIEDCQTTIDRAREEKETRLKEADMPIAGLSLGADDVEFEGIEFSEISQAQKIKVSMAIAMAQSPKLKVIRIKDGSLLDEQSMQAVEDLAEKFDFQIFIERVGPTAIGETFYIEEGTARRADQENNK